MPLILALAISTAIALGQPRVYESSARIWFYGQDLAAAIGQPNTTPADQQTAVFRELLNSRAFDVKVGHRGPLAGYLSDPSNVPTDLLSRIRAKLGGSATAPTADQVDQRIWDLLARRVIAGPDGPEVVAISFQASTPAVAQGTVQALVDQFMEETVANRRAQAQAVVTFMEAQLKTQDAAVASPTAP
ncbi:MAG TPA: hypothetical protein VET26_04580, partial [Candidatus Sulfotelmatobacter sp.]|nr:hypothetical protein [Candidatus Sulfotelmatobacter sp.]